MSQVFNERFEGGSNGTALSTSNTSYATVNASSTTLTFDSSTSAAGSLSDKIVQTANFGTGNTATPGFTSTSTMYRRFCVRMTALPSGGTLYIASFLAAGPTTVARVAINSSGQF